MRGIPARRLGAVLAAAAALATLPAGAEELAAGTPQPDRHVDAAPPGASLGARLEEIRRRIQAALVYPPMARFRSLEGETLVRFEIGADRRARSVEVTASSGERILDAAAARAVGDAGTLPYVHGPLEVPVRFSLADGVGPGRPSRRAPPGRAP